MGIRGLTTFIQNRSHLYLESYELHDTNIVIDGNAITCQLYKWHCNSNDCFGGDYDKFANLIGAFFQMLSECNITPYVVFDGGYETRKIATVMSRMRNKIKSAEQLNSVTEGSISVFPLFLRETFQDIVLKLNIKCVRCDFEGDTDTASIARTLDCPVLSYDSDYFIFDVAYVPFSTFEMCVRKKKNVHINKTYSYISCKIYKVDQFLSSFGGMDKRNLPILAVLLGNDYIKQSVFSLFYQHIKLQYSHCNQNEQQRKIKTIIIWLRNETPESALQKILSRYKSNRRKLIGQKILNALKGYNCVNSNYLKYLEITPSNPENCREICIDEISASDDGNTNDSDLNEDQLSSEEENSNSEDVEEDAESDSSKKNHLEVPIAFLENFRNCLYPSSFMDILLQNKYYCIPQVENYTLEYSHAVSVDIISAIHKILTKANYNLVCIARDEHGQVKKHSIPFCDIDVPDFMEIQHMNLERRKAILLNILKIDESFVLNCLNLFPESWHLFIITIKYLLDKSVLTWPFVYSLVLCKIFLGYVDSHIGICRSYKLFERKFGKKIINNSSGNKNNIDNHITSVIDTLESITYDDSLICVKNLVTYFQINEKMKTNNRIFNRNLVHSMAQFQSCSLHIKYLNSLLNLPYANFIISDFYNGTFIYNLTSNFMKRPQLEDYMRILLQNSPSILNSVVKIIKILLNTALIITDTRLLPGEEGRKRNKRKPT